MKQGSSSFHLMFRAILFILVIGGLLITLTSAYVVRPKSEPYELKYPAGFGNRFTIPVDNPMTKEGVALGRMLFYEVKLSNGNQVSCATCHKQKLAFADDQPFSFGVDGSATHRNSMSLTNLLWVRNLFWDGRAKSLEDQAVFPLTDPHEMGQSLDASSKKLSETKQYPKMFEKVFGSKEITGEKITKAIAQFERSLLSINSKYDQYLRGEYNPTESELNGLKLFTRAPRSENNISGGNCSHCHGTPKTFSELFHNNGLDSVFLDAGRQDFTKQPDDAGRFRVPTLRNIALTAPYMHDGRFNTLTQVLDHYSEHIMPSETLSPFIANIKQRGSMGALFTAQEKTDVINFLRMLTDEDFIRNPEFSDPNKTFKK